MATTFSGLKLQGEMGKFGQAELSDVYSFVEMADGKVITGSENGKILVWEGVFVKCELVKQLDGNGPLKGDDRFPHQGAIDAILVDGDSMVSGGHDGYLRWWTMSEIDMCEADYDSGHIEVEVSPTKAVRVPATASADAPHPAQIQNITPSNNNAIWMIQDLKNGCVWMLNRDSMEMTTLVSAHSRDITNVIMCPKLPGVCVTAGIDGTLRAHNSSDPETNVGSKLVVHTGPNPGVTSISLVPAALDPYQCSFAVGYEDGVVRFFSMEQGKFVLRHASKPHSSAVVHIAYNTDGSWICTASADNSIFFFEVRRDAPGFEGCPVGFLSLPCRINRILWNDETGFLLVCLEDGVLLEVACPVTESIDNSESYEIRLNYRSVAPEILPPEPEAPECEPAKEESEVAEEGDEEGSAAPASVAAPTVATSAPAAKEEEEEVDLSGEITEAVYLSDEVILFAGTGCYAGHLWEVSFQGCPKIEAETPIDGHAPTTVTCCSRNNLPTNTLVTYMDVSISDTFLLLGFQDGRVWIAPFSHLTFYIDIRLADCDLGAIRGIALSPNDTELVFVTGDGGMFVLTVNPKGVQTSLQWQEEGKTDEDGDTLEDAIEATADTFPRYGPGDWEFHHVNEDASVLDITDPDHASIQEAKLKSEEENLRAAAERQKKRVRERVKELRKELEVIRKKGEADNLGLPPSAYIVDFDYVKQLNIEMGQKELEVQQRLAWDVETNTLLVNKLLNRFLENVDFDYLEVTGFRRGVSSTFRSAKMSDQLQENLAKLHALIFNASDSESDVEEADKNEQKTRRSVANTNGEAAEEVDLSMLSSAQLREHRKHQRQLRKKRIEEVEKAKPQKDQCDDPRDIEAILEAERTLGNYMLKTSPDYKVPENQRMNWEKKRRQMFLLEESIHSIKTEFNQRVLALRSFKQQVKENLLKDLEKLGAVERQLGVEISYADLRATLEQPPVVTEYPEIRLDISPAELGNACGETVAEEDKSAQKPVERKTFDAYLAARRKRRNDSLVHPEVADNPLAIAMREEAMARLKYDRGQLQDRMEKVISTFDEAVASLGKEKMRLCSDLKTADMKLLTLYDELQLLNELEEMDCQLLKKSNSCRQDKTSVMHQIKECQDTLASKKAEIEQWQLEEGVLQSEFTELVGENSPFLATLLKIYKKKVKRSKRKKINDDEDYDEEEDESEEESDLDSDEDDDEIEEDICPQGCDMSIYESVIELRDKRLDMEDALLEIQKAVEELKKTHQRLLQEERRIDKEQKSTDDEIQKFQTEKQQKLNQIGIVFELRLSQFQCIEESKIPQELNQHVVFTRERLAQLRERITQLHQEKHQAQQNHKQLKKDYVTRYKEKKVVQAKIEEIDLRFQDIQLLKFGQTVDLDLIEKSAPNKYVRELQTKVDDLEKDTNKKQLKWQKKVEEAQEVLATVTQENSVFMEQIVNMGYSQLQLDTAFNARIANVTVNDQEPTIEQKELERERMRDLLTLQSKEIATLQAEINIFRKKGGHIYTTVTANRLPAKT